MEIVARHSHIPVEPRRSEVIMRSDDLKTTPHEKLSVITLYGEISAAADDPAYDPALLRFGMILADPSHRFRVPSISPNYGSAFAAVVRRTGSKYHERTIHVAGGRSMSPRVAIDGADATTLVSRVAGPIKEHRRHECATKYHDLGSLAVAFDPDGFVTEPEAIMAAGIQIASELPEKWLATIGVSLSDPL